MVQKFVGFLLGCVAVVSRNGHFDIRGNDAATQPLQTAEDVVRHGYGVGALALGNGDRDGGKRAFPIRVAHILGWLLTTVAYLGNVADKDRLVVHNSGNDIANIIGGAQKLPGLQEKLLVAARELARGQAAIGKA